ncbi:MAG: exodeoxyribonuclease VII small subunit [Rhodothermales bacterium]|nr:exodeoxyribonuclease VII small subunit [Rhodothermales bacterium]
MTDTHQTDPLAESFDYEGSIHRIEEIAALLEDHDTKLEDALKLYEEGVSIARSCMQRLRDAELRIAELRLEDTDSSD